MPFLRKVPLHPPGQRPFSFLLDAEGFRWSRRVSALAWVVVPAICALACAKREEVRRDPAASTLPEDRDPSLANLAASAGAPSLDGADRVPAWRGQTDRIIRFKWRPPAASIDDYAMEEVDDQHQLVLMRGVARGGRHPVLIALHGQPKRGESPRNYAFAKRVTDVVNQLVERGDVLPIVVALPVFRYRGTNWPNFDLVEFQSELARRLAREGVEASGHYVIGHSGAAGCGGDGMNRAHRMQPLAVGFFDTCLGPGWREEVLRLREARVPTLMVHSLETAAFVPRQVPEYSPTFDFGRAYGPAGLSPSHCPERLPSAPLRSQPFRCASDEEGITRALVVDSGDGEEGHNAVLPIALSHFLREYVGGRRPP